jgi:hypothetical protein
MLPDGAPLPNPPGDYLLAANKLREEITTQPVQHVQQAVVPVLVLALKSAPTPQERRDIVRAIGALGPASRTALPVLKERLEKSHDPVEVKEVLRALSEMGPAARDALPTLVALSDRPPVRTTLDSLKGPEGRCGIDDRAGCFSVQSLRRSNRMIRAVAQRARVEILFETVRSAGEVAKQQGKDSRHDERLKAMGPRAIHVVFTPRGEAVEVHVSEALRREGLTAEKVRKHLLERVRHRQYDRAVNESVQLVTEVVSGKK